ADASPATRTSLPLSAARIRFGHEQTEKLSVRVTPARGGTPTGKVTITAGSVRLCIITLRGGSGGKGSCKLAASRLRPGTHHLRASYGGSTIYRGSSSARHKLTV